MKKGGVGGANTQTGAVFEKETELYENIGNNGYTVIPTRKNYNKIYNGDVLVGYQGKQASLYDFLLDQNMTNCKDVNAVNYRPDDWFYNFDNETFYIIEKKHQMGDGSTVQKLFGCGGLEFCYLRLFKAFNPNIKFQMIYQLNPWHDNPKHQDYFDYFEYKGVKWFFTDIPLAVLGLKENLV